MLSDNLNGNAYGGAAGVPPRPVGEQPSFMPEQEPEGLTLRDYLAVMWRRKWIILLVVVVATGSNWPDALSGSSLAGAVDGPLLLVKGVTVPTSVTADWFPAAPANAQAVYDGLVAMLQPGPIPSAVSAAWLAALLPSPFTWNAASQTKARELAFLILCSPAGQLY